MQPGRDPFPDDSVSSSDDDAVSGLISKSIRNRKAPAIPQKPHTETVNATTATYALERLQCDETVWNALSYLPTQRRSNFQEVKGQPPYSLPKALRIGRYEGHILYASLHGSTTEPSIKDQITFMTKVRGENSLSYADLKYANLNHTFKEIYISPDIIRRLGAHKHTADWVCARLKSTICFYFLDDQIVSSTRNFSEFREALEIIAGEAKEASLKPRRILPVKGTKIAKKATGLKTTEHQNSKAADGPKSPVVKTEPREVGIRDSAQIVGARTMLANQDEVLQHHWYAMNIEPSARTDFPTIQPKRKRTSEGQIPAVESEVRRRQDWTGSTQAVNTTNGTHAVATMQPVRQGAQHDTLTTSWQKRKKSDNDFAVDRHFINRIRGEMTAEINHLRARIVQLNQDKEHEQVEASNEVTDWILKMQSQKNEYNEKIECLQTENSQLKQAEIDLQNNLKTSINTSNVWERRANDSEKGHQTEMAAKEEVETKLKMAIMAKKSADDQIEARDKEVDSLKTRLKNISSLAG
ncbi:hypothetical protein CC80DRAFT_578838 [Byssothecium circinans]|uniref:Uncharacterized protein n=1 Tax=Byssothecium circinans TaxID=147558 RepID=A0A6A5TC39_9PLEO|nr:hypothetical protein CC80DRAFT_578838 [Byssothecium circinans]